jgi:hypothetical protein
MAPVRRDLGVFLALLLGAPLQCPARRGPELAREETPGEALWQLAERFEREGNEGARRTTLQQIIDRYPSSRFAQSARVALDGSPDASAP